MTAIAEPKALSRSEIMKVLAIAKKSSTSKALDGSVVHVWYKSSSKPSKQSLEEAQTADKIGLPRDHYTGRLVDVWEKENGDLLFRVFVSLERPKVYRTFNATNGQVLSLSFIQ